MNDASKAPSSLSRAGMQISRTFEITTRRPVAIFMVVLAVAVFGYISYQQLPLTLMPDISYPSLTIRTDYPDTAPEEVERRLAAAFALSQSQSFVAGVLTVLEINADKVQVNNELCVDDVCVTADDLRVLLDDIENNIRLMDVDRIGIVLNENSTYTVLLGGLIYYGS